MKPLSYNTYKMSCSLGDDTFQRRIDDARADVWLLDTFCGTLFPNRWIDVGRLDPWVDLLVTFGQIKLFDLDSKLVKLFENIRTHQVNRLDVAIHHDQQCKSTILNDRNHDRCPVQDQLCCHANWTNCCRQQRMDLSQPHGVTVLWLFRCRALRSMATEWREREIKSGEDSKHIVSLKKIRIALISVANLCSCGFLSRSIDASLTVTLLRTKTFIHFLVKSLRLSATIWWISKIGRRLNNIHVAIVLYQNSIIFTHSSNNFNFLATMVTVNLFVQQWWNIS